MFKLLICDVDGTLTDGSIIYDDKGNEIKKFCTRDGAGFFAANEVGIQTMILTGRECKATQRRMEDLKVDYVYQGVMDKVSFLKSFCKRHNLKKEDLGYIGDDLNDISAMKLCGFIGCPADSCEEVKLIANYISDIKGGSGAVRAIIEYYLKEEDLWNSTISKVYRLAGI